jgi:two-component system OmpR family sensor kinase/two-component system sensor histidine kinase BaeS
MNKSTRQIRFRLWFLLLRALGIAVFSTLALLLLLISYFLIYSDEFGRMRPDIIGRLEGYYLGHGSWEGVEQILPTTGNHHDDGRWVYLLDQDGRVVLDTTDSNSPVTGSKYAVSHTDFVIDLYANGEKVGQLVDSSNSFPFRGNLIFLVGLLFPFGVISFFLSLLTIFIGVLLVQRLVNPLAEVIAAAREVANGKLDARVTVSGPQDLRVLNESFNEMAASLERNDRERREMFADIAHELRTPLSIIRGRLEGIVDGIYSVDGSQVSMALEQTYLLQRLVDDLRLLTLAETRQLPFDKRDVNVGELIERVLEMFSAEAREKNITLTFPEKNGNLSVEIDPQRFEQVISNLLGNALRYVPNGGKIWVTANESADSLRITVNDNGAGVPAEDLPYIFDRFWRKEKSRSRASGGTGLGLAIAKQLIEAQGGVIEAHNLPEGGLQVVVEIRK